MHVFFGLKSVAHSESFEIFEEKLSELKNSHVFQSKDSLKNWIEKKMVSTYQGV